MSTGTTKLDVVVSDVVPVNDLVKRFHFRRADGGLLPTFSGGAHVVVEMRDGGTSRPQPLFADEFAARHRRNTRSACDATISAAAARCSCTTV